MCHYLWNNASGAVTQVFTYDLLPNHYNGCWWLITLEWQMVKDDSLDHDHWHWMTHIHWTMTSGTVWLIIQLNNISLAVCVTFSTYWIIHKFSKYYIHTVQSPVGGSLSQWSIFHFGIIQYILFDYSSIHTFHADYFYSWSE